MIGGISKGEITFLIIVLTLLILGAITAIEFLIGLLTQDVYCQPTGGNPR